MVISPLSHTSTITAELGPPILLKGRLTGSPHLRSSQAIGADAHGAGTYSALWGTNIIYNLST